MDYSGYQLARVQVVDAVASVVINNPPINIFDLPLYGEMAKLAGELASDNDVRVVVLSSANPDFFIPHFDVGLILQIPQNSPAPSELNTFTKMCESFREMPKATIAVIEGRIGGGGSELALSCAMRCTKGHNSPSSNVRFTQPHFSAVSASISSQPSTTSSARERPTKRERRTVPLPPGMMPSATSG